MGGKFDINAAALCGCLIWLFFFAWFVLWQRKSVKKFMWLCDVKNFLKTPVYVIIIK